jgi:hypothetical protein
VRRVSDHLGLRWEAGVRRSYAEMIGELGNYPKWSAATSVFGERTASPADAGTALRLERAWVRHD